jgi:hypothetical protein
MARARITLQSGGREVLLVENLRAMSMLMVAFECRQHDIDFRVSWVGDLHSFFAEKGARLDLLHLERVRMATRSLLLTREGLYLLELDNRFSWLRAKTVDIEYALL